MTHEIVNKIIWHDLTEDPNDLPKDQEPTFILTARKEDGFVPHFTYDRDRGETAVFYADDRMWSVYELYTQETIGYTSYGQERLHPWEMKNHYEQISEFEVIAWAEMIAPNYYIPKAYRKEESSNE